MGEYSLLVRTCFGQVTVPKRLSMVEEFPVLAGKHIGSRPMVDEQLVAHHVGGEMQSGVAGSARCMGHAYAWPTVVGRRVPGCTVTCTHIAPCMLCTVGMLLTCTVHFKVPFG